MELASFTPIIKAFANLTPYELYDILKLRSEVFVVEQQSVFLEMDGKDQHCHHLMLSIDKHLAAYTRLVPPGISYPEMSIGRVVTSKQTRGTGLGKELMKRSIQACYDLFGLSDIRIGAQVYAIPFYETVGFVPDGAIYDEDGIDHIAMVKKVKI